MFAVDDLDDTLARLREHGAQLVDEVVQYEDVYRLCYVRGLRGSYRAGRDGGGFATGCRLRHRGSGLGPVAVTSRCGTQSSTWLKPSKRPPSCSTTSKKERR